MNYYEQHLGDYARDAGHLTMLEDGAYRRLIDAYYSRERALPADVRECCKLAKASTKPERDAVAYVLREFFDLQDDGHHQKRCDKEIARFKDKQAKASRSANARWGAKPSDSDGTANASPDAMRTHSEGNAPRARPQSPVTKHQASGQDQKPERGASGSRLPDDWTLPEDWAAWAAKERPDVDVRLEAAKFADYWHAEPGKNGRKVTWLGTWRNWIRRADAPKRGGSGRLQLVGGYQPLPGEV